MMGMMTGDVIIYMQLLMVFMACTNTAAELENIKVTEHCEAETFHAKCEHDEAVLMVHAKYGRMKVGRCVLRNYGYVGCSSNVLPHMDHLCSGKEECVVRIPDASLDKANPCPGDFKTYLETAYECVKVTGSDCRNCRNGTIIRPTAPVGFLSSQPPPREEGALACGGARCPWVIQAPAGQRLNVTLLDFSEIQGAAHPQATGSKFGDFNTCYRYAVISEESMDGETEVCGGHGRERSVYTSIGSTITILPINGLIRGETPQYLFIYTVFGCADLEAPPHAWIKREGNNLEVGCRASNQKYHLECNGQEWTGSVGQCPPEAAAMGKEETKGFKLPTGILVSMIVGIALIIGALILTLGLVLIRRRKTGDSCRKPGLSIRRVFSYGNTQKAGPSGAGDATSMSANSEYYYSAPYAPSSPKPKPCYETIIKTSPKNFYHHTMDLRPLPSVPCVACNGHSQTLPHSHSFNNGLPHSHSFTNAAISHAHTDTDSEYTPIHIDLVKSSEGARPQAYATIDVVRGTERADRACHDDQPRYDTVKARRPVPVEAAIEAIEEVEEKGADAGSEASLLSAPTGDYKRHSRKSSSNSSTHSYCVPLTRDSGDYSDAPPYYTLDPNAPRSSQSSDESKEYAIYQPVFVTQETGGGGDAVPVFQPSPDASPVEVAETESDDELDAVIPASETQNDLNEIVSIRNSMERRSASPVENEYQPT